jgi:DNA repair exonuclease SbcCD nuclease subunit
MERPNGSIMTGEVYQLSPLSCRLRAMTPFRFLQLSDLHLGRPFTWLPTPVAEQRRAEQRDLLWRAVEAAIERKLDAILIAGDLFDGEVVDRETVARAVECVSQPGCPPVFIAPGNHDCFSRSTFYYDNRRLAAAGQAPWPAHVHVFDRPAFTAKGLPGRDDVLVWGRCVDGNVDASERVLADDRPTLDGGRLHVLLFHGSRDGSLPPGKRMTAPFDDDELLAWGADYAALGHYHRPATILDEDGVIRGAYSGSPLALAIDETGPRHVQIVTVEHTGLHRRIEMEPLELDRRRLHRVEVQLGGVGSPEGMSHRLVGALEAALVGAEDLAFVTLTGRVRPGVDLVPRPEAVGFACFHLSIDARDVRPDYDLEPFRRGEARTTEERFARSLLVELENEADPARRRVIEAALYYGLDAIRFGDVAPRYEHVGDRA